jgi:hypothetical protein
VAPVRGEAPTAPEFRAVEPADATVVLKWDNSEGDVEWYHVYRSMTKDGPYEHVDRMKKFRATSKLHGVVPNGPLENGTMYYYVLRAESHDGEMSPPSRELSATPTWNTKVPVPRIIGSWWRAAPNSPDLEQYDNGDQDNACDFTLFQAKDATWQLISCIRSTKHPGRTRLFYRWEAENITDTDWTPKGIFATSRPEAPYGEVQGRMQAPHCFLLNGTYHLFYNSAGAHLMTSHDGKQFERTPNHAGSYQHFPMGRDVYVLNNIDVDGKWYAYYTNNKPGMAVKSATDLMGPWSEEEKQVLHHGFFESPFVQRYAGRYYLFAPCKVFVSRDPLDFDKPLLTNLYDENGSGKAAIEIVQDKQSEWYIAGYGKGVYIAPLEWDHPEKKTE